MGTFISCFLLVFLLVKVVFCDFPLFNSVPGTFVMASVSDQLRSAVNEVPIPWPGFSPSDTPHPRPLYGLTYFPWRTVADCANITHADIESDIRLISEVAGSIYIHQLYCDFGPLLVNLTRKYDMSILIGLPLTNETEFHRQRQILHDILMTPNINLSHVVAVSVGHNELGPLLNSPNVSSLIQNVIEKIVNITEIVDLSPFPDIPVTITDFTDNIFRRQIYKHAQIYIGSYNSMDIQKNASLAATMAYDGVFQIRNAIPGETEDDDNGKPVIITDIGWASGGYFEENIAKTTKPTRFPTWSHQPGTQISPFEQLLFLYYLRCPQFVSPPMYYVRSAFDQVWKLENNDSAAHYGLADAITRQWKPGILKALNDPCGRNPTSFDTEPKSGGGKGLMIMIGICVALAVIFVIMCILVLCFWRWKRDAVRKLKLTREQHMDFVRNVSSTTVTDNESRYVKDVTKLNARWDDYLNMLEPDYEDLSYMVAPNVRIDMSDLELKEIVGEGHFGIVQRGTLYRDGSSIDVAVKRLHVGARNVHQFLQEGIKMQMFNHPNVLNLIGISFTPTNLPMIITPYLHGGNVLDFVRKPEHKDMPLQQFVNFCYQIAEGMRYLHDLKMIHRDLAARNCMLDNEMTVKIADFGLCRDISDNDSYHTTKAFELPIRWMPPEAIEKLQWSSRSDVWSYGIAMWELLSRGQQPYSDVPLIELRAYLKSGGRLGKPNECPDIIYEIMKSCWGLRPTSRPDFADLCQSLPIVLQALERGDQLNTDSDYYNSIVHIVTANLANSHNDQISPPQSHASPQPSSSGKSPKKTAFSRGIFTWTLPKHSVYRERKKSLP